jgi:S-adenosylmethionine:diacylglycerol 3-amino-3-carboxypropyl transferase
MTSEDKVRLCRVVGMLILADGQLTDEEYDFFYDLMDRLQLNEAERAAVKRSVQVDANIEDDVQRLRDDGEADRLLDELRRAASVDGEVAKREDLLIAKIEGILKGDT